MYTTRKVTNHHTYVLKCDFFNATYTATLQPHANYYPGFKFLELPGASLNVIGILNTNATPQDVEQLQTSDTLFASEFYQNVLIPSIEGLPHGSKTRMNNLVTSFRHSNTRPIYFHIYESDLPALFQSTETQFATSDHNNTYRYFFLYFKFGQMNISMQFLVLSLDKITTFLHILPMHFFN